MSDSPKGLDLEVFAPWFAERTQVDGDLSAELIAGGKSNLTYRVTDGAHRWVVRRPPLGHVLATAHDMGREHTVMAALHDTDVPVPAIVATCADDAVLGAPFYVMEQVDGTPYRTAAQLTELGADRTRTISTRMVQTLAALHAVDPEAVGLGDFGRPEGFLARQVRRWKKQVEASHSRDLAGLDELVGLLEGVEPPEQPPGIVHGDYRLDNLLVEDDEVRAVIDWEMSTLGDPVTDVALLLVYDKLATLTGGDSVADASAAPGFLGEDEILSTYVAAGGREPSGGFGFHTGLAYFKLAAILEGIHYRYVNGQTVGEGFDSVGEATEPLIAAGIAALREN
ncbi:acyl-CoA dehydrogenase [Marmoricola endophyticus]|uniref:Acyl-CoA dehydrogenase n=1 Tax=Marmoricola endophyticus TaxID=2040280 RepID=A0A917BNG1_9ACTN|nr:phosphotransferase family protein [Marmoricola endophyticus]GGF52943.1 acyl-CoA dehydrogenase [Marmoricola endophyticus]